MLKNIANYTNNYRKWRMGKNISGEKRGKNKGMEMPEEHQDEKEQILGSCRRRGGNF